MEKKRSNFTGKLGFVLAAAGSAVGLGNIWRFPYLAAKYGGGIFLLVYIVLAITFGYSLMMAETAIGRKTGLSAIGAFRALGKKWSFIGYLESLIPIIILPYYCVIGGWVTKYFAMFVSNKAVEAAQDGFFGAFIAQPIEPVFWFALYLVITSVVVLFGVEKGVEKVSKFMMPVLVFLSIGIAAYSIFMPGAMEGVIYYLKPDFSKFSVMTVVAAMGQMFYSMSLSMGIMITYGSYMKKDINMESSVHQIEIFDTGIAFLAGLMIIPAVFAFSGGNESALGAGPGLMFETLPKVFESMTGGTVIGALFFMMVFFAALTSSISLMEAVVSIIQDKFGLRRHITCIVVLVISVILGLMSLFGSSIWSHMKVLNKSWLDFFDFITNSVMMPLVALFTCLFVGYVIKPKAVINEAELTSPMKSKKMFTVVIKYIAPVCIVIILISSILDGFGIIKI